MVKDSAIIAGEVMEDEKNQVSIRYYNLKRKSDALIESCEGDIIIICNVLADYASLLEEILSDQKDKLDFCSMMQYGHYMERCKKIRRKFEEQSGYDRDKALEKCLKKRKRARSDDVGEDAMVLAVKRRAELKAQQKAAEAAKKEENNK